MLWQKESDNSSASYIDLLKDVKYPLGSFRMNRVKNNLISETSRIEGNNKLFQNDLKGAMKCYNQSVGFAENTDYLSLAYGNRSYCFLKLNMLDRCLVDIERAEDSNYPDVLLTKLEKRKELCLKKLVSNTESSLPEPTLSFEKHEKLPCMVNILQIEKDALYGRLIRAKQDIPICTTIIIEKAYVRAVAGDEDRCVVCGKQEMNFIPCTNCADTLYCSEECANNSFHKIECKVIFGHQNLCDSSSLSFILRSIIIGINAFSTVDEMQQFVEKSLFSDPHEIYQSTETLKSKYRTFFKLASVVTDQRVLDFRRKAFYIFHAAMSSRELGVKFQTTSTQRFLVHLIIHHGLILSTNSFGGCCGELGAGDNSDYQQNIFLMTSYFNHSCIPNVIKLSKNNLAVVKTIQPIKLGQQLFLSYLDRPSDMNGMDRNDRLDEVYGFRCKCELCTTGFRTGAQNLEDDEHFVYVIKNVNDCDNLISEIKQHCIAFLMKFPNMIPSEEGIFILSTLGAILQKEISGEYHVRK